MFEQVSKNYQLGNLLLAPQRLDEKTLHSIWKITTEKGSFAVKQFNTDILQLAQQDKNSLNAVQEFAQKLMEGGVSTIAACKYQQQFVYQLEDVLYMVFPWSDAKAINPAEMNEQHIYKVGVLLAEIHQASSQISMEVAGYEFPTAEHTFGQWQTNQWDLLKEISGDWIVEIQRWIESLPRNKATQQEWLVSHRDFDSKNILWNEKAHPILIDWDYAGKIDTAAELFIVLLNWANLTGDFIDIHLFHQLMMGYQSIRNLPLLHQGVINFYCDYVIDWISFNLGRLQKLPLQKNLAIIEINRSLNALAYLRQYYGMISQVLDRFSD